eukprot:scaffold3990_cov394-Prasinococcus_capsulatus_cf.AAC.3
MLLSREPPTERRQLQQSWLFVILRPRGRAVLGQNLFQVFACVLRLQLLPFLVPKKVVHFPLGWLGKDDRKTLQQRASCDALKLGDGRDLLIEGPGKRALLLTVDALHKRRGLGRIRDCRPSLDIKESQGCQPTSQWSGLCSGPAKHPQPRSAGRPPSPRAGLHRTAPLNVASPGTQSTDNPPSAAHPANACAPTPSTARGLPIYIRAAPRPPAPARAHSAHERDRSALSARRAGRAGGAASPPTIGTRRSRRGPSPNLDYWRPERPVGLPRTLCSLALEHPPDRHRTPGPHVAYLVAGIGTMPAHPDGGPRRGRLRVGGRRIELRAILRRKSSSAWKASGVVLIPQAQA